MFAARSRSWRAAAHLAAVALLTSCTAVGDEASITVYKSPTCGCCNKWIDHLEQSGFEVTALDVADVRPVKRRHALPPRLSSCHTALVGDYVIEGHVPATDISRLLRERPPVVGLAVPGMPEGSPGMEGPDPERYRVLSFDARGQVSVFATHGP